MKGHRQRGVKHNKTHEFAFWIAATLNTVRPEPVDPQGGEANGSTLIFEIRDSTQQVGNPL
jgi:hypothetical protein